MKPTYSPDIDYKGTMLRGDYDDSITPPADILGFEVGYRVASSVQITQAVNTWQGQSDRMKVIEYAKSHEGRPLFAVFIASPGILNKLDEIQSDIAKLADPRSTSSGEAKAIMDRLPAVAWMAYSIHGNETSGADAALASIYHLIADKTDANKKLLDEMLIVIDPLMNPDGRDRFAKSLEQYRSTAPNVDNQSLLHRGDWPYGRTNHYLFDLNRDFFYLTQPETKGRVALINKWRPQLMIDGHEMGSQDTYLMGPPREPLNKNIAPSVQEWAKKFAVDQSQAFDQEGWRYYTGEWFENWYPGYSNYAEYRGSMHILYEQSRIAEDGVRRPEGTVQTYMESVHHQYVSTMANLNTLQKYSKDMYADYWQDRQFLVSNKSPYSDRTFVISNTTNQSRLHLLAEKLLAQDIEISVTTKALSFKKALNHLGKRVTANVPKGSLVVLNRQPEARLLSAIMEFDSELLPSVIEKERQEVLRSGDSIMYDTSAWNLTMMYGLNAYTIDDEITANVAAYTKPVSAKNILNKDAIAWIVDGSDDKSLAFAARLMERGVQVRVIDKSSEFNQQKFARGSVAVTITDNVSNSDLITHIQTSADELGLKVSSITQGLGDGELPDWGGDHFVLLTKPQIAFVSQANTSSYDLGSSWWSIDSNLGIRHSHLDGNSLNSTDLRRYNTIVVPSRWSFSKSMANTLLDWVKQGGTLITHNRASRALNTHRENAAVRNVDQIFEDAEDFNIALQRRILAEEAYEVTDKLFASGISSEITYPWAGQGKPLKKDELEKRDDWQKLFMPAGAFAAGSTDQKHWLTFGVNQTLPLLYRDQAVLVANSQAEIAVSVGVYEDLKEPVEREDYLSWYALPLDKSLHVRMSGLLWPEAANRIANSAFLTRERHGNGQIIMFAGEPNFRGATWGTNRLWLNAVVYGAGFGARYNINL
ncbi:M14 family metallopeptidase [Glaciecola petra]|uniref:M14 family metallopeptidase n=1 Tax=Glaciecola petra TaxID=3075602 RepID=A0ABU2ZP40_9ALTE|nr:M14 family metallopeptidase [Aestuariibacter sp. P117]MDT0594387.1 M14 family metallopeptidase [Aestuariibacter sp. P117]